MRCFIFFAIIAFFLVLQQFLYNFFLKRKSSVEKQTAMIKFKLEEYEIGFYTNVNDNAKNLNLIWVQKKNHSNSRFVWLETGASINEHGCMVLKEYVCGVLIPGLLNSRFFRENLPAKRRKLRQLDISKFLFLFSKQI